MTSPSPRVAARVPALATRPVAFGFAMTLRARMYALRASCGDSVGILKTAAGACVIFTSSLPAFPQAGGLTLTVRGGGQGQDRTVDLPLFRRTLGARRRARPARGTRPAAVPGRGAS